MLADKIKMDNTAKYSHVTELKFLTWYNICNNLWFRDPESAARMMMNIKWVFLQPCALLALWTFLKSYYFIATMTFQSHLKLCIVFGNIPWWKLHFKLFCCLVKDNFTASILDILNTCFHFLHHWTTLQLEMTHNKKITLIFFTHTYFNPSML